MKVRRCAIAVSVYLGILAPGHAGTLIVDNDLLDCPQADHRSIQVAVAVAQPGDKVLVCPGIYTETVVVDKPDLRIEARGGPGEVVVQGTAAQLFGFHLLNTTGVRLQGFTVKGFGQANIIIQGGGGNTLHKNITTEGAIDGIEVIDSDANIVEHNISFANNGPRSDGIFLTGPLNEQGQRQRGSRDNVIRHNETFNNGQNGINVNLSDPGNVVYGNRSYRNRVIGILNGLSHGNVIEHNDVFENGLVPVPGAQGVGVGLAVANSSEVTVKSNRSENNGANGFGLNNMTNSVVTNNRAQGNRTAGINLNGADDNLVEENQVVGNLEDGVRLLNNADRNTVRLNHARRNGRDGIRVVDALSAENTIERNVMLQNGEHDAHDDSVGPGSGGTANFWIGNRCETENRFGLCENP